MKSLILYDSKTGCTKKCATYIHIQNNAEMLHINDFKDNIDNYDKIVLLSPIYMGQIKKTIKSFIDIHHDQLLTKKLTICLCAMNMDEYEVMLENNFDQDILSHANIVHAGGAYYFDKLNFIYRFIVKKITGITKSTETIKYDILDKINL